MVDDDRDIARFVEVNLQLHGFEVAVAMTGSRRWPWPSSGRRIVDVRMPRMDGLELTRRLRAIR